jgi:8-oxo-dGTP diphosphatase
MEKIPEILYNVGVKAAIRNTDGQFLVLQITRKNSSTTYWDLPGGRIQEGEEPEATLAREVLEETGIDDLEIERHLGMAISRVRLPSPIGKEVGVIFSLYAGKSTEPKADPEERITLAWCTLAEAIERLRSNPDWPSEAIDWVAAL